MKRACRIMKWILLAILAIIIIAVAVVMICRAANASKYRITSENGIQESLYIDVGGIKQYIKIYGDDVKNPVMLVLHGGPGGNMTYVSSYYGQYLSDSFTIVDWDQRGCGRTYYANPNMNTDEITEENLLNDIDGIVDYLCGRFECDGVIILGHSWGTLLGTDYVRLHPEKVTAYIGAGQVVNFIGGDKFACETALSEAEKVTDSKTADKLRAAISKMDNGITYDDFDIKDVLAERALAGKYLLSDGAMSGAGQLWMGITSPDMNFDDVKWVTTPIDKLFDKENGLERHLLEKIVSFDIYSESGKYDVPMYFITGSGDWITPYALTEEYCNSISAPEKAIIKLDNAGHALMFDNPEKFAEAVKAFLK